MSSPVARYQRSMALGVPPAGQGRDTPTELEEAFTKYSLVEPTSSLCTAGAKRQHSVTYRAGVEVSPVHVSHTAFLSGPRSDPSSVWPVSALKATVTKAVGVPVLMLLLQITCIQVFLAQKVATDVFDKMTETVCGNIQQQMTKWEETRRKKGRVSVLDRRLCSPEVSPALLPR
ncbi:hypothetical protein EYF80_000979 [Liparis tanakae]|uniref:Uncharacterized protein n=1 Tax=Liparis tanakae TaxID=230148 RepID=A0A4Z2JF91_9TELE|nr:hypothetical protein EYF80_000979 [Liparis tanakae]